MSALHVGEIRMCAYVYTCVCVCVFVSVHMLRCVVTYTHICILYTCIYTCDVYVKYAAFTHA